MSGVTVEPLTGPYTLGEGPHWDPISKKLYFVDIFAPQIHRYDPCTNSVASTSVDGKSVGFAIPVDGAPDKLVAGVDTDLALITWNEEKDAKSTLKTLVCADSDPNETRWNDAKADSCGRLWAGTMSLEKNGEFEPHKGSLYSMNKDLVLQTQITPVTISNGIAWSINNDTMYYIDSMSYKVVEYDYDSQTGDISNKRTVFDIKKHTNNGLPDGMTIDSDGNLWVAVFGGGGVYQVNPKTCQVIRFVEIKNVSNVTSVAFGGDNLDILYVTTASIGLKESELKEQPLAGYVFAIKGLGVRGLPANTVKLPDKLM